MTPPGSEQPTDQAEQQPETQGRSSETMPQNPEQHKRNCTEYLQKIEQQKENRDTLRENYRKYEENSDLYLLRAAGQSLSVIKNNPNEKHSRLSAAFLEMHPGMEFEANFDGNKLAENGLDLTDFFPPNVLEIDVKDENGDLIAENAKRSVAKKGGPGYFDADKNRIKIKTGYRIIIKKTQVQEAMTNSKLGMETTLNTMADQTDAEENAQNDVILDQARDKAEEEGKELPQEVDKIETIIDEIRNFLKPETWENFKTDGNFDFQKLADYVSGVVERIGPALGLTAAAAAGAETSKDEESEELDVSEESTPTNSNPEIAAQGKIDREWLKANVGKENAEVMGDVVQVDFFGGVINVHKHIAPYLIDVHEQAKQEGIDYTLYTGDTHGQTWRTIRNKPKLSLHSWGYAFDLNATANPEQWLNEKDDHVKKDIPDGLIRIFESMGFTWGGRWRSKKEDGRYWTDPMHFEYTNNPFANQGMLTTQAARDAATLYLNQ